MSPRRRLLLVLGFVFGTILLVFSLLSSRTTESKTSNRLITVAAATSQPSSVQVTTQPKFDFTYEVLDNEVLIRPLSLLAEGSRYVIDVVYVDVKGRTKTEQVRFIHSDQSKAAALLADSPVSNENYSLYVINRHSFYVRVTASGFTKEEALLYGRETLEEYGVNPDSVELDVEFSRGATEDGGINPFTVEPDQGGRNSGDETPNAPGSANQ